MSKYGIRFYILDLGVMKSDVNLVAPGSVIAKGKIQWNGEG